MALTFVSKGHRSWLSVGLVLVCWLGLAPGAGAQAPYNVIHRDTLAQYESWLALQKKQGFRPIHVSGYSAGKDALFAAIASKDGKNFPWEERHGQTVQQHQQTFTELSKKGYRMISVSGYQENNATRFASLWVKDGAGGTWEAHHNLTEPQYRKFCDDLNKKGLRVLCVSGYPEGNDARFAAIWVADKKNWIGRHNLTEPQYQDAYRELWPKGYRPASISAYLLGKETRFAVVFTLEKDRFDYVVRHNQTATQYQTEFDRFANVGGTPVVVTGYPWQGEYRYAEVFTGDPGRPEAWLGKWSPILEKKAAAEWPTVVAIHAALLPTGKVLMWPRIEGEGPPKDKNGNKVLKPNPVQRDPLVSLPQVWDPVTGAFKPTPRPPYNIFCSAHAFLPDGTLFVAGGHMWSNYWGDGRVTIYDPYKNIWIDRLAAMNLPRWYPSCVTLASGDVLVLGGTFGDGLFNLMPQIWLHDAWIRGGASDVWRNLKAADLTDIERKEFPKADSPRLISYYPFLHVAPNGQVFKAGPNRTTWYLDSKGEGKWERVGDRQFLGDRDYGSSVMYEPGKVILVGGGWPPTETAEVIDLNIAKPSWQFTQPMFWKRRHGNATLLADGTVFASGGTSGTGFNNAAGAVFNTETWDPRTMSWYPMAAQHDRRLYHSTALLLPDGRVLSAGGGEPAGDGKLGTTKDAKGKQIDLVDQDHRNAQIYSPPYLFAGPRPALTSAPAIVGYGKKFEVKTPDAKHIRKVTFIRLGSATHARNFDQRLNYLDFQPQTNALTITAPPNANMAPPGHYMLFILNERGVPSVAKIIRIG